MPAADLLDYTAKALALPGAVAGAAAVAWKSPLLRQRRAERKRLRDGRKLFFGMPEERDGDGNLLQPHVPGLPERFTVVERQLDLIASEVTHNHGHSSKDYAKAAADGVASVAESLDRHIADEQYARGVILAALAEAGILEAAALKEAGILVTLPVPRIGGQQETVDHD